MNDIEYEALPLEQKEQTGFVKFVVLLWLCVLSWIAQGWLLHRFVEFSNSEPLLAIVPNWETGVVIVAGLRLFFPLQKPFREWTYREKVGRCFANPIVAAFCIYVIQFVMVRMPR